MSLEEVQARIRGAAERTGRDPAEVRLIVVTKSQTVEDILGVYELGHRDFGENRAQDLMHKASLLPSDIRWHFVGRLQTNKVRSVRPLVVLLHSMDRAGLAKSWIKGPGLPPPVLLQVNLGHEPQKGGVAPEEAEGLARHLTSLGLNVQGLMVIPPLGPPDQARRYFRELGALRERLAPRLPELRQLSMGMTDDYDVAVEEGSTMVRVGRAIFGATDR